MRVKTIERAFESSDSFTYRVQDQMNQSYVAKIFRFAYWPPAGKIETIMDLLDLHDISHEQILYLVHSHDVFVHGWQISYLIEGGTAHENLNTGRTTLQEYLTKTSVLLKRVHEINLSAFGSVSEPSHQNDTFHQFVKQEMLRHGGNLLTLRENRKTIEDALSAIEESLERFPFSQAVLVHDDVNPANVMWKNGDPLLIDWVDSVGAPPLRDFATLTFRSDDDQAVGWLEDGYGKEIDRDELFLHQLMRIIRLASFYYFEDNRLSEYHVMVHRLQMLLQRGVPFGCPLPS